MATTEELGTDGRPRPRRADAERNLSALLESAKAVFAASGVDAPAKEITDAAGLGVGTLYRHFPRRADLIVAVLQHEIDACADAATALGTLHTPYEALRLWVRDYVDLVGTKRGLAAALHSGETTFAGLHGYVAERLEPAVDTLLAAAVEAGEIAAKVEVHELLVALSLLCQPVPVVDLDLDYHLRMVTVFVEGLRPGPD